MMLHREQMIKHQVRTSAVVNPKVLDAMSRVPRENFVDPSVRSIAYSDTMLPIGCAELMLPSRTHGLVMQHIEPDPKDHVLIIGGGTGYLSGCLSTLVKKIYAIEKHADLVGLARQNLEDLACKNVTTETKNFFDAPINTTFNKIIFTASFPSFDTSIVNNMLTPDGCCFVAVGNGAMMRCLILTKQGSRLIEKEVFDDYIPQIQNIPKKDQFIL
jgi:protein-L-isoaspartate(D-aspartate) O-methyltransferase